MEEIWKDITGYEGLYQVSSLGNVKSLDRYVKHYRGGNCFKKGATLKPSKNRKGYYLIVLAKEGISRSKSIHRIVAETFIPNQQNKPQVNHKDGNKTNNSVQNLEWATQEENMTHAFENGLNKGSMLGKKGVSHPRNLLTQYDVNEIKKMYNQGVKIKYIANSFNVSYKTIQRALKK